MSVDSIPCCVSQDMCSRRNSRVEWGVLAAFLSLSVFLVKGLEPEQEPGLPGEML